MSVQLDLIADLPRLAENEFIPEINGLTIDPEGRLVPRDRRHPFVVTFECFSRQITARLKGERDEDILMQLGCRLARLPYTAEDPTVRRHLMQQVRNAESLGLGTLAVTHHQWLYLRCDVIMEPAKMTAGWLVTQLTYAALLLRPTIALFADGASERAQAPQVPRKTFAIERQVQAASVDTRCA